MIYFNLFSNILITKGVTRILVSDLQRNVSELYPLELYEVIEELKINSIEDILKKYDVESKEIFNQYLNFLLGKEYGFITEGSWDNNLPPLSLEYHDYSYISDAFIEMEDWLVLKKILFSVESLMIKHLVIYSSKKLNQEEFLEIDNIFENSALQGIEIFSPFHEQINKTFIKGLNEKTARIYNLVFYNCKRNPFKIKDEFRFTINFTSSELELSSCGKVDMKYFNTNMPKVLEAINHNSCLHKKIGIDRFGNIKNCPLMPQSFGNIKEITLEEALSKSAFRKYWNLTKDNIEVCKDCEFRYICTDCRAYTECSHTNEDGLDISKPLKCGYNPYTGEWKEWSKNPLKQKAIQFYSLYK
ncbi:grasp-with-spasm system SPASM domain peptide maturase [Chryseobacterium oryctis]|uniref:Grasp-with-spasm system SPASM domain peptide maturase n=1 Tax=Chryseobacterium oryctis TaxID=2952618 RepID=A0ABT3HJT2_9FLAO|nr:grasp-with-spasm system SPASM domain peptide maturase [Chryseobacterium oryctis]MCW3159928.1 grasp-with-spasm system SPASM domain peptide maturase [Chryseobacterium oryctis]